VAWNGWSPAAFDPYPFVFFNLVLAVTVVLQGPLIMMAQNREVSVERAASEADYQVNLKNEMMLEFLLAEVRALRAGQEERPKP
jgi:CRP/FNR family cyclic AMP-dependent transcriptional regulator